MKTIITITSAAALALCGHASAQTAYTKPIGYVSLGNPDGNSATPDIPANTDVTVSIPFDTSTEYAGVVSSVNSTALTLSVTNLPALTGNPATPYQVKITSGPQEGLIGLITANTSDSITVGSVIAGNLSGVQQGVSFQISKAWTLSSFLNTSLPVGTQVLAYSGTVRGINVSASYVFVWSGTSWIQTAGVNNGLTDKGNTIIFPGESFILRTGNTPITSLVVNGTVPATKCMSNVFKIASNIAQDTRFSINTPTDQPISSLRGMQVGDNILAFNNTTSGRNKSASQVLVWTGTQWFGTSGSTGDLTQTYNLKAGHGFVYRRPASAPISTNTISLTHNYISNL